MDRAVGRHDFRLIAFVFMPEHVHLLVYRQHVESYCVKNGEPTTEQSNTLQTFHPVWQLYGRPQAWDFGPLALKACRQWMIDKDPARNGPA